MDLNDFFGPTAEAHQSFMAFLWGPIINISLFLLHNFYSKQSLILHLIIGVLACLFTITTALSIGSHVGLEDPILQDFQSTGVKITTHYKLGFACMIILAIQTILGFVNRIANMNQARSIIILRTRGIHQILGYLLIIICKANIYIIAFNKYRGIFSIDCIFIVLIFAWKFFLSSMQKQISPEVKIIQTIKNIKSLHEISQENYCIFANYVYDLEPLMLFHPAGMEVVKSIKSKEVDRYIYGMYSSQFLPKIEKYSHLARSFNLLNQPLYKLTIPSLFSGVSQKMQVKISLLRQISINSNIYQIRLRNLSANFKYQGYTGLQQLGRYYSLTYNNKVTRLYTTVNFLVSKNVKFLRKILNIKQIPRFIQPHPQMNQTNALLNQNNEGIELGQINGDQCIPILFKLYSGGQLTQKLIEQCNIKFPILTLSCPKGEGLHFGNLKPGKIILLAGGTGLYPFCDLIDLLFKETLMKTQQNLKETIEKISPILKATLFKDYSFHLILAVAKLSEIHPFTLEQILFLTKNNRSFTFTLKLRAQNQQIRKQGNVNLHEGSFTPILQSQLQKINMISQIYICGPPRMNEQFAEYFKNQRFPENLYTMM